MKKTVYRILSLLITLLILGSIPFAYAASGTTYYLSGSAIASDDNDGRTPETPLRTLAALNDIEYFPAGSRILFEGGYRYGGNLRITPNGTAAAPVEITSYGQGTAILTDEGGDPDRAILECWNAQYTRIHHLRIEGTPGTEYGTAQFDSANRCWGIMLAAGGHTQARLGALTVDHVEIANTFGGIEIVCDTDTTGYDGIFITDCTLDKVYQYGIFVIGKEAFRGGPTDQFSNVQICRNTITDMYGDPNYGAEVQPICAASGTDFLIEGNAIHRAGGFGGINLPPNAVGGSTGIGVNNCRSFAILHNVISDMNSYSYADASAIDIDQDAQNGEVAYNLTYNNRGPSVQLGSFGGKITGQVDVHHNLSHNDAQGTRSRSEQGVFRFFGNTDGVNLFNNTVYLLTWVQGTPSCLNFEKHPDSTEGNLNVNVFNNIFRVARKGDVMPTIIRSNRLLLASSIAPSVRFFHNAYSSGETQITICNDPLTGNGVDAVTDSYTGSLHDWQALGQEKLDGAPVGLSLPELGIPTPESLPETTAALTPDADSPCVDAAIDPWPLAPNSEERTDLLGYAGPIRTLGAITRRITFTVTAAPMTGGSVSGLGTYDRGQSVTLTLLPDSFYNTVGATLHGQTVTVTDNTVTFTLTENTVIGATFAPYNLQDFIHTAQGAPVYLNNDFDVRSLDYLYVPAGETLDLNGYTVYAKAFICHGTVRDSKNGQGRILLAPDAHFEVTAANNQLPLYDSQSGGYRLFDFALISRGARPSDTTLAFGFQLDFTNPDAYSLLEHQSRLSLMLDVSLRARDGRTADIPFAVSDDLLALYGKARREDTGNVIVLRMYNTFSGLTASVTPCLTTQAGSVCVGSTAGYTVE